jgi:hypothetical protein
MIDMKKSKMAVKKGASKINPKKKPVAAGKTSKKKPAHKSAIKKAVKKPVVKMAAKAKKPQVKIQSKPAKPAPKTTPKQLEKKNNKVLAKPTSKPSAKPSVPEKPVAALKGGKGAPAQAVAAVLTKGAAKAPKAPKVSASSERMCREASCENVATTKGYCRLDYIKNWKKIKRKEMILKEGKLNQYIEELVGKYPDKYIDIIRQDLSSELSFNKVIHDLELDESIDDLEYDGDSIDALIGGIKKDIEDIGEDEF